MAATLTDTSSDVQLWHRLVRPDEPGLTPDAARFFLTLEFGPDDRAKMHDLVVRNQDGELSGDELDALAAYRRVSLQLDVLRAKARLSLHPANGATP